MSDTVLVVEDDDGIALPLLRTLEREGHTVERLGEGLPAVARVAAGGVCLMILDLGLPDVDGLDVCQRVRAEGYDGALIILTARGGELDRVVGLDMGADDYLPKPFALSELLARVRALLRRQARGAVVPTGAAGPAAPGPAPSSPGTEPPPSVGPAAAAPPSPSPAASAALRVDPRSRRAWARGAEIALSAKEFDLLAELDAERGAVLTREALMDRVWDENWFGSTKTLDVTVGRLRQKLEASGAGARIVAVRGVGFRLEDGPQDA
ncbi:response regulator transcription factor [Georgenia ruanii]|uniref:Response regulator n=1 Tax=Georgenia ruanii TaxID=348442 RepID=A0A7J9UY54_9MICO|nr:response regulator transcription factor [Georgenia ruanii]MPV89555.1 response regulator [Georgenia ruanii]